MIRDLYDEYITINKNNDFIEDFIKNRKAHKLFRCDDGRIYYYGDLYIKASKKKTTVLPDNFTVYGCLTTDMKQTFLPKGLVVTEDFTCIRNGIKEIPDDIVVGGELNISHNKIIIVPNTIKIGKIFFCPNNKIKVIPNNMDVGDDIYCHGNDFKITKTIHHHDIIVDDEYQELQDRYLKINRILAQ